MIHVCNAVIPAASTVALCKIIFRLRDFICNFGPDSRVYVASKERLLPYHFVVKGYVST